MDKKKISDEELEACLVQDGCWLCPEESCQQVLSRKQTLKTHLWCIHSIKAGNAVKRYKEYEQDDSASTPKTTKWRSRISERNSVPDFPPNDDLSYDSESDPLFHGDVINEGSDNCITESFETEYGTQELQQILQLDNIETEDMEIDTFDENESASESDSSEEESTANYNTSTTDEEKHGSSVPLYVLPPNENIYSSDISHNEHLLSLCAFSTKNNLSGTAFCQLMKLINIHLPEKNLCETNVNRLKEKFGFGGNFIKYYDYCDICGALFPEDKTHCFCATPHCKGKRYVDDELKGRGKNFFVSGDLRLQLKEILENSENWEQVMTSFRRENVKDGMHDILDGKKYQELKKKCKKFTVTLTMFTDGVSLFKSSKIALWPVYLVINELRPQSRFVKKNMVLWGLWQGQGKPKMNTFFFPFVKEMIDLYHIGLTVETSTGQQKIYVIVSTMTMDLQARAGVFNMTQHNGLYSCIFCEEPGLVVKVGKGHTRCFPYREEKPKCRSSISIEQNVLSAIEAKKPVYGFFGRSIIKHLPFIDFHESCTVDYMHGFLLGITKKLLSLWIAGSSYQKPYFIGHNLKDIDKILKNIKVPYLIHRIPRKIENNLNHWKASEFRSFLLFYALPCLKDFLPGNYLEHFACLIEATFLLLQEKITPRDIKRAELLLDTFYKCSEPLYGDAICGLNVHNISHIIKLVEDWGPLWTFSCFSFESFNGEISKSIHGKGNVSGEVYWAVHSEKIIENEVKQLTDGKVKQLLQNILRHNRISSNDNYEIGDQCYVMKPLVKVLNIEESLKEQISDLLNTTVDHLQTLSFFKAAKIRRNNFVFYSQSCGKVKQRNSYTVLLHKEYKACDIVQIQYFLQIKEKRKTFAVGNGFMRVAKVLHGRVPSIQKIDLRRQNLVIQTSLLEEHVVYMEVNKQQIVGRFPNFVEKD